MGGHAQLILLLGLLGCSGQGAEVDEGDEGPLPRAVALVAMRSDGEPVSVYFAVEPNPRGRIDVRVADAMALPGPRGVHAVSTSEGGRWQLVEEVRSTAAPIPLPPGPRWSLLRLQTRQAWFSAAGLPDQLCELPSPRCAEAPTPPSPLTLRRPGPGGGFRLDLTDGTVRFWPPHLPVGAEGERIVDGVATLLAVRWLEGLPAAPVREYLDRTFHGLGGLVAAEGAVALDGALDEWRDSVPDVVESPWQVAVRRHWTGPDDASFSVAALATPTALCFAGRIRDDDLREGDVLTLHVGEARWTLPLRPGVEADGLVVQEERFGYRFEVCREGRPPAAVVPFAALLQDRDGEDEADMLSTSPIFRGVPAGTLRLPPPGQ